MYTEPTAIPQAVASLRILSLSTPSLFAISNAFSKIKIGDTLIEADTKTDELTLEAGSNITLTPDTAGDKIIISAKDTTYTNATTSKDGLMSSEDKTKLDGIDEEANNSRGKEVMITKETSKIPCYVIPTDEELMIARDTYNLAK